MSKTIIYADNAATAPMDPEALDVMVAMLQDYANPSQPYSYSRNVKNAIIESKEIIASCMGAHPDEIYFTSGGSESDNWAIKCHSFTPIRNRILTSSMEHHAILNACIQLSKLNRPITYVAPNEFGLIEKTALCSSLANDVSLVSIMSANNELGTIQPIGELSKLAHEYGSLFHTDAVQAVGHININLKTTNVDLLSASAHKFNGPKGIGFMFIRSGTELDPLINGGSQQSGMRAGTENAPAILAMAIALRNNCKHLEENQSKLCNLEKTLLRYLDESDICYSVNCGSTVHLPGLLSLSFPGYSGESILHRLDLNGICISTGSACNSHSTEISHVLSSIGLSADVAKGTIRISLGKYNTESEVKLLAEALIKIITRKIIN